MARVSFGRRCGLAMNPAAPLSRRSCTDPSWTNPLESRIFASGSMAQLADAAARKNAEAGAAVSPDERADLSPWEQPGEVVNAFMEAFYSDYIQLTFDNASTREEDALALVEEAGNYKSTTSFIEEIALLTNLDAKGRSPTSSDANAIRLSTIHQAKGLEWKAVFIIWAVDGMLPSYRAIEDEDFSTSGGLAEERRLFYVAVTRAKDDLFICVPKTRRARDGSMEFAQPSRFLVDIPSSEVELVEPPIPQRLYPREPHFGY